MLAPHETLLQKIVHYASRITVYNALVSDTKEGSSDKIYRDLYKNLYKFWITVKLEKLERLSLTLRGRMSNGKRLGRTDR